METKNLYLYYQKEGTQVELETFCTFGELLNWCNNNCTKNGSEYFIDGHKVLCSYKF